ncbi:hypothetical protein MUNTM_12280 [Mycobacterium sp. MUNTM1]
MKSGERLLIRPVASGADSAGIYHRQDLTGLHQNTFGVAQQFGIALGGAFMESRDRAIVARFLPKSGDQPSSSGSGGETC